MADSQFEWLNETGGNNKIERAFFDMIAWTSYDTKMGEYFHKLI